MSNLICMMCGKLFTLDEKTPHTKRNPNLCIACHTNDRDEEVIAVGPVPLHDTATGTWSDVPTDDASDERKQKFKETLAKLAKTVNSAEADWINGWMKRLMPGDLYDRVKNNETNYFRQVAHWIEENLISIREGEGVKYLVQGEAVLGTFRVEWKGTKISISVRDLTKTTETPNVQENDTPN